MTFRGLVLAAVFRPWYALHGRRYYEHLRFLERSQWWGAEQIRDYQWAELKKLLKTAFDSVPYYRQKYAGACYDDIRTWDDFARLPCLTREEIRRHREELRSTAYSGTPHPHATGGSSGEPVRFYRTIESYDWRTAARTRTYGWSGLREGVSSLHLWGSPVGIPPRAERWKTGLDHWLRNERIIPTFVQSPDLWDRVCAEILRRPPEYMVGYVSSLVAFGRFLAENHPKLPAPGGILAAAEPLEESQRAFLAAAYRAPVFNTYGCREFMSIAGECDRHGGMHVAAENLVVETADPGSAEPSEILVTDLHNHGTVFLRYALGDGGILSPKSCDCGRGLPLLEAVAGRSADTLELPRGRVISGIFFRHILKDVREVVEFQITQPRPDHVVVSTVLSNPLSDASQALFEFEMRRVLQENTFEMKVVDSLIRGRSGKKRTIIPFGETGP